MENENEKKEKEKKFIETIVSINIFQLVAAGALQAVVGFWTEKLLKKWWNKKPTNKDQKEKESNEDKK